MLNIVIVVVQIHISGENTLSLSLPIARDLYTRSVVREYLQLSGMCVYVSSYYLRNNF